MATNGSAKTKDAQAAAKDGAHAVPVEGARKTKLKWLGGSDSDTFNVVLANSALQSLWLHSSDPEYQDKQKTALTMALQGIAPKDELEGMLAAQLVAANAAAMECYRRAMIPEQTFAGRQESLNQANKLSRTYVTLLEALNRHRGKSTQQRVTVEHVHVHAGGQAVVGAVRTGGGVAPEIQGLPHASAALAHVPVAALRSQDEEREPVPAGGHAERTMPDARRKIARCATG